MVNTTIIGYAQDLLNTNWEYLFDMSGKTWTNISGSSLPLNAEYYMGYAGAGIAFLLSLLGALENAGQTIYYVEWGMDTWLSTFGDGTFEDVIADAEQSKSMQTFIAVFTVDLIAFSLLMIWHSMYIISTGFAVAYWIMYKYKNSYQVDYIDTASSIPADKGQIALLFGVLIGTINYFSGNVTKNSMEKVMLSMGFMEHEWELGTAITTVVTDGSGEVTSSTETGYDDYDMVYDYKALLEMQDKWSLFFTIQRGMQLATPYLFEIVIEGVIAAVVAFAFIFVA